jgi:hypothetical protein
LYLQTGTPIISAVHPIQVARADVEIRRCVFKMEKTQGHEPYFFLFETVSPGDPELPPQIPTFMLMKWFS